MVLRNIIFKFIYYSGLAHLLFTINKFNGKIPILLFHRVSPHPDACWPPLTPLQFEKIIKLLSRHYKFYSLDELLETTKGIQSNACCIVFDDGFYDFKEHAFPILVKNKVPVTLFLPTNNIDENRPLWTSEIDSIILYTKKQKENNVITIGKEKIALKLTSEKDLFNTSTTIKNTLLHFEELERNSIIGKLRIDLTAGEERNYPMLSWADIHEMKAAYPQLLNIQSHTHTHPYLPTLKPDAIAMEFKNSLAVLNKQKLNPYNKIAYPVGGYDPKTIEAAKKYYAFGFKVENRLCTLKSLKNNDYKYQIPRHNIHTSTPYETFIFANGFHSFIKSLK